jgi:hypothetical protein
MLGNGFSIKWAIPETRKLIKTNFNGVASVKKEIILFILFI